MHYSREAAADSSPVRQRGDQESVNFIKPRQGRHIIKRDVLPLTGLESLLSTAKPRPYGRGYCLPPLRGLISAAALRVIQTVVIDL